MLILLAAATIMQTPADIATTPANRLSEAWWKERHERCVETTQRGGVDLVFLGDSITQGWEGGGKAVWDREYAPLKAANFGFSGDRTEHVLWRLANGEIVGLKPKLVVLMIGTNNIGHNSSGPEATAAGVKLIVRTLLEKVPSAKILVLGIFPRGAVAEDPMRVKVAQATRLFEDVGDGRRVFFLDIGKAFIRIDGTLRSMIMPDLLHLNGDGYEVWAKAMGSELRRLLETVGPEL